MRSGTRCGPSGESTWARSSPRPAPSTTSPPPSSSPVRCPRSRPRASRSASRAVARATRAHGRAGDHRLDRRESSDPDWFDLGILIKIDGRTIPFEPLFTALSKGRKKLLLVDGSYFSLNHRALDRLRELIDESGALDEWETGPRISRYQTDLWEEFEDLADEAIPAVSWRATADGLRAATSVPPVAVPSGITAELRPYQKEGLDWLAFLWSHRLGGILADDMGVGKTLQLLALIVHAREAGERRPFLAVVPTSVLATWRSEAERFAPTLRVRLRGNTQGPSVDASIRDVDLLITHLCRRPARRGRVRARRCGPDSSWTRRSSSRTRLPSCTRAIASFRADVTFAVTGTPMENSLSELWALLKLTAPGLFASARKFREQYIQPIEQGKVPENEEGGAYRQRRLEQLRRRIRPLLLRRTKELVAPDLPAKQEQILEVELSSSHRALYDVVLQRERQKVLGLLEDLDRNRFIVFRSLTLDAHAQPGPGAHRRRGCEDRLAQARCAARARDRVAGRRASRARVQPVHVVPRPRPRPASTPPASPTRTWDGSTRPPPEGRRELHHRECNRSS